MPEAQSAPSLVGRMRPKPPTPPKRKRDAKRPDESKRAKNTRSEPDGRANGHSSARALNLRSEADVVEGEGRRIPAALKGKGRAVEGSHQRSEGASILREQIQSSEASPRHVSGGNGTARTTPAAASSRSEIRGHPPVEVAVRKKGPPSAGAAPLHHHDDSLPRRRAAPAARTPVILTASKSSRPSRTSSSTLAPRPAAPKRQRRLTRSFSKSSDDNVATVPPRKQPEASKTKRYAAEMPTKSPARSEPLPPSRRPRVSADADHLHRSITSISEPPTRQSASLAASTAAFLEVRYIGPKDGPSTQAASCLTMAKAVEQKGDVERRSRRAKLHQWQATEPHGEALYGWSFPDPSPPEVTWEGVTMRYWREPPTRQTVEKWAMDSSMQDVATEGQVESFDHVRPKHTLPTSGKGVLGQLLDEDPTLLPRLREVPFTTTPLVRILIPTSRAVTVLADPLQEELTDSTDSSDVHTDGLRRLGILPLLWCDNEAEASTAETELATRNIPHIIWTPEALRCVCAVVYALYEEAMGIEDDLTGAIGVPLSYQFLHADLPQTLIHPPSHHLSCIIESMTASPNPSSSSRVPECDGVVVMLPEPYVVPAMEALRGVRVGEREVLRGVMPLFDERWACTGLV